MKRLGLDECPDDVEVFLDANILYYHFTQIPPLSDPCSDFVLRIAAIRVEEGGSRAAISFSNGTEMTISAPELHARLAA